VTRSHSNTANPVLIAMLIAAAIACAAPIVARFYWPAGGGMDVSGNQIGRDFLNTWAGPQIAFDGRIGILYQLRPYQAAADQLFGRALEQHNYSYSPATLLMFAPLGLLPYGWALAAWLIATFALVAGAAHSQVRPDQRAMATGLLLAAPASLINTLSGQNGFLTGALLMGGIVLLDRRPTAAGVLLGLLTCKPHLGLVAAAVLLALGAWRSIAAAAGTTAILAGASLLMFGMEPWVEYLTATRALQLQLLAEWRGFFIFMMPTWFAPLRSAGVSYATAMAIQSALAIAVVALACLACRGTSDPARRAFVVATATPLALPYAFNYDLVPAAVAIVWVVCGRLELPRGATAVLVAAWLAPLLCMYPPLHRLGLAPVALTALFAMSLLAARQTHRTGAVAVAA
jgi:Glycosyltransferase family 87